MKPRIVIAGAGLVGRELAMALRTQWKPIVIDLDSKRTETLEEQGIECHVGDVTSTLTLNKARIRGISYALAATGDDEVNLEFCKIMKELFGASKIVSLVHDHSEYTERLESLGVFTVSSVAAVLTSVRGSLDQGRRTTVDIGLGEGEIIQVTVQGHSSMSGRALKDLRPQSWLLAAVYRQGRLIVPHGETVIEPGDQCLLVGTPEILQSVADFFQSGESHFPRTFGERYVFWLSSGFHSPSIPEMKWLLTETEAEDALALRDNEHGDIPGDIKDEWVVEEVPRAKLPSALRENQCAVCVVGSPILGWRDYLGGMVEPSFRAVLDKMEQPVLISRGSHPYKRIVVAVSPSAGSVPAAELGVDLARKLGVGLTALAILPPQFVVGDEYEEQLERTLETAKEMSHLYARRLKTTIVKGNPILSLAEMSKEFDLLIISHRRFRSLTLTRPDVSLQIAIRASCSVLMLPYSQKGFSRTT